MSRPSMHRTNNKNLEQDDNLNSVRTSSLHPMFNYIRNDSSLFKQLLDSVTIDKKHYEPSIDIKPILKHDKEHIKTCIKIMSEFIDCRQINPEYNCEQYRDFLLRIKCI